MMQQHEKAPMKHKKEKEEEEEEAHQHDPNPPAARMTDETTVGE
jgi:hypothetical protein